jgi:hypothetical protein
MFPSVLLLHPDIASSILQYRCALSLLTPHPSPLTPHPHPSPLTSHPSPLTP